jgi:predicted transcriptional regulator
LRAHHSWLDRETSVKNKLRLEFSPTYTIKTREPTNTIYNFMLSSDILKRQAVLKILDELCELGRIVSVDMSYVAKGRIIYKITEKGKKTIETIRDPLIKALCERLGVCSL